MTMLSAEKTHRRCIPGNMLSTSCSRALCLALVFLVVELAGGQKNTSSADSSKTDDRRDSMDHEPSSQMQELELMIVQKEDLKLNMNEAKTVRVNFTLYCSHPSVAYAIRLCTENADVATVSGFEVFNISCADLASGLSGTSNALSPNAAEDLTSSDPLTPENPSPLSLDSIPAVHGVFNFTLQSDLLGRTWLKLYAQRFSDPGVLIPSFLRLPWNNTKTPGTEPTLVIPEDVQEDGVEGELSPASSSDKKETETPTGGSVSASNTIHTASDVLSREDAPDTNVPHDTEYGDEDTVMMREAVVQKHVVTVLRVIRPVDVVFRGVLYGFVIMATIGMGCKTDMGVVKEVLKKPVAPAIGFFCQYLIMPLIAFTLAKTLVVGDPAVSLGIFTCGICPGGGPSNFYSFLLDGDVSLSVTMTAISSMAALAMIPLWLFTLGTLFEDDKISLTVPFGKILITLSIIIIPLFVGFAVKKWAPKVAKWVLKLLKPFTLIAILFLVTFGVYTNLYVFRLFSPRTLLAGCLLPYIGYTVGGTVALILRQPCYRAKTIAIETGIQNTSIGYLLLVFSLPKPDGDMAAVGPMASALMTPLPLLLLVVVYLLYKRFCKKKKGKKGEGENGGPVDGRRGEKEEEAVALKEGEVDIVGEAKEEKNGNVVKYDSGENTV
ncbi:uncharacterized protein LOC143285782 [Babylonia areolata]|uniref:uncharacterized protein LOC143285782 n=1 Tax=Babylonia areolata TaxID=304850 RepID=UPI003FD4B938